MKGKHKHPLFYWVWPKMKIVLDIEIAGLKDRLKDVVRNKKNMLAEDHLSLLMEEVGYTDDEWTLLINCAMAGKSTVKKYSDDEQVPQSKIILKKLDNDILLQHTFPEAVKILFCFNIYSQVRSDYAATRVLYPMEKKDMPQILQKKMTKHDPTAVKGFIELRIVEITDVRVEFDDKDENVGVYYENEPETKIHTIRPVFKCRLHPKHEEFMNGKTHVWLDAS